MSGVTLVTGGTGKTGRRLVERLTAEGWPTRCASRSGQAPPGAEGVAFDWYEQAGLENVLAEVERVYLVAPIGDPEPLRVMGPCIEKAVKAGARRFVLLSSSLVEEGGPIMGQAHALLRRIAPEWAVLRPTWFMENFTAGPHFSSILEEDAVYSATGDGRVPFVCVEDIAEVAFRALTVRDLRESELLITGAEALSYGEAAARIGAARGRGVRHVRLTPDQLAGRFVALGLPPEYASVLAGLDLEIAKGAEDRTTSVVERWTGRAPVSFQDFAGRNAGLWRRGPLGA